MYLVISEKDAVLWKLQAGLECYCGIHVTIITFHYVGKVVSYGKPNFPLWG